MASIVLGIGSSHGPSIQTSPDGWPRLGDADSRDPRFNYEELLKTAPADIEDQISPQKHRERHAAAHAALTRLRQAVIDSSPDVLLIISNPHRTWPDENRPVFGVLRAATLAVAERGEFDPDARFKSNEQRSATILNPKPGHPELANHLIASLNRANFDVAVGEGIREGQALDDAFAFAYEHILQPNSVLPVVPFMLSRYLPYQATAARCYALGKAIRKSIDEWNSNARVALLASGGLSHQVIDEELDREVIQALETSDEVVLSALESDRLNLAPGTPETLNWVTLAGAMAPTPMSLVDYLPCYRSMAGTGHGLTFGLWR